MIKPPTKLARWLIGIGPILILVLAACGGTPEAEGAEITELPIFPGPVGPRGLLGPRGSEGLQGSEGPAGERGPQGAQGIAGITGIAGLDGTDGLQGSPGEPGLTGAAGLQGEPGLQGPLGLQGPRGLQGSQGIVGAVGPQGSTGLAIPDISDYLADARDAIVLIDAGSVPGSGVRISPTEILTTQHLVGIRPRVDAMVKGEGVVSAEVVGYDTVRDLALLSFESSSNGEFAQLPDSNIVIEDSRERLVEKLGYEIAAVGYAFSVSNQTPIATFGRIGAMWDIGPDDISVGQVDAPISDSMAGGGVFNSYGELLGILTSGDTTFVGNTRYLRFDEIQEVISQLRKGFKD